MKEERIRLRRLGWAGVEIEYDNSTLVIDFIQDTSPLVPMRNPAEIFPASSHPGKAVAALLTHLHADHADPGAISQAIRHNAPVFRPERVTGTKEDLELVSYAEDKFEKYDLHVHIVSPWEEYTAGPFRMFTAPAVDGFGDPQVSWIIECGGKRILHAGDTLFHGYWWRIAHRFGPFDVAFLPVNGAVVDFPHLQPASPLEAVMTPEEAAVAANILSVKCVVPIHYGSLHKPPIYLETPHCTERLMTALQPFGIRGLIAEPEVWFEL